MSRLSEKVSVTIANVPGVRAPETAAKVSVVLKRNVPLNSMKSRVSVQTGGILNAEFPLSATVRKTGRKPH